MEDEKKMVSGFGLRFASGLICLIELLRFSPTYPLFISAHSMPDLETDHSAD